MPGNWETQGFGTPIYTNFNYPWPVTPPYVPAANPTGVYRLWFDVPAAWLDGGHTVCLAFEGVNNAFYVHVNGEEIGYSQDSCLPAEFDVTHALAPGRNLVAVQVMRFSDGSYLEDQDHWWLSGLYRAVHLVAKPAVHVSDFYVRTPLELAGPGVLAKAWVDADVHVTGPSVEALKGVTVRAEVYSLPLPGEGGEPTLILPASTHAVCQEDFWVAVDTTDKASQTDAGFGALVRVRGLDLAAADAAPRLWSAEAPHLYALVLTLLAPDGSVLEAESTQVGLRVVDIVDRQLRVNGVPVYVKGVNRHEHDERAGKALTDAGMLQDILLMKQMNFNAVRCSHYPNDVRWCEGEG